MDLVRMLALWHRRRKVTASNTNTRMTTSWIASADTVKLLPSSCWLCDDDGFAARATPTAFKVSTSAISAPKVYMTLAGGMGG